RHNQFFAGSQSCSSERPPDTDLTDVAHNPTRYGLQDSWTEFGSLSVIQLLPRYSVRDRCNTNRGCIQPWHCQAAVPNRAYMNSQLERIALCCSNKHLPNRGGRGPYQA